MQQFNNDNPTMKQLKLSKNRKIILGLLLLTILCAIFIRTHHFQDWLLFRADQTRDAYITKDAYENGPSHLRILGPKIEKVYLEGDTKSGGGTLSMGPYFYYSQYLASFIFRTTDPWIFALPDLILSILSIPLFYFFLRQFFPRKISLISTILFSFSFIITQYTRFSWNPNQIIFWSILLLLSLYRSSFEEDKKKAGLWLITAFLSLMVLAQLHFIAFAGFPIIAIVFWIIYFPKKIKLRYWLISVGIILLFNTPLILSDIKNDGNNAKRFQALFQKEGSDKTLLENTQESFTKHGMFYSLALTSFNDKEIPPIEIIGMIFVACSIALVLFFIIRRKKIFPKEKSKWAFLVLPLIYFLVFFLIYIKIADRINKPRYWMSTAILPFVFISFWFYLIDKIRLKTIANILIGVLFIACLAGNIYGIYWWYSSIKAGVKVEMTFRSDPTLRPHRDLITLGQMKEATEYMNNQAQAERKVICYHSTEYQVKNGFEYLLNNFHPDTVVKKINKKNFKDYSSQDCEFFVISKTKHGKERFPKKFLERFDIVKYNTIGAIILWDIQTKEGKEPGSPKPRPEKDVEPKKSKKIEYWKDF
jgi:hypothetical protein